MAYGFQVLNNNGEIVLDDTSSPIRVVSTRTVAGIAPPAGRFTIRTPVGLKQFNVGVQANTNFIFFQVPVGATVGTANGRQFFGYNINNLNVRECAVFTDNLPALEGWGMRIYDPGGSNILYTSEGVLNPINRIVSSGEGDSINTPANVMYPYHNVGADDTWFCVSLSRTGFVCFLTQQQSGFQEGAFWSLCGSVSRISSTQIQSSRIEYADWGAPFALDVGYEKVTSGRIIIGK